MKKKLYWVLIAVFAAVFLVSGFIVVDYLLESQQHQQMMEELRDLHTRGPEPSYTTVTPPATTPSSSMPGSTSSGSANPTTVPTGSTVPTPGPTDPSQMPTEPGVNPTDPVVNPTQPIPGPTEPVVPPTEPVVPPTEPGVNPTDPVVKPTVPTQPPIVQPTILSEMQGVYALNQDVVGWIYIKNTNIDYPVMQTTNRPDYYIDKDFYGNKDKRGCIYAEENNDVFGPSDVVVIHGHHMADGSMFNNINEFKYKKYFTSHPYVQFDTLYERRTYEVVLVFRTNGEPSNVYPFFPFHTYTNFKDEAEFDYFMSSIRGLALQQSDVEVNYGDKLLCLSTCDYSPYPNGRMVLVCKLIES